MNNRDIYALSLDSMSGARDEADEPEEDEADEEPRRSDLEKAG